MSHSAGLERHIIEKRGDILLRLLPGLTLAEAHEIAQALLDEEESAGLSITDPEDWPDAW